MIFPPPGIIISILLYLKISFYFLNGCDTTFGIDRSCRKYNGVSGSFSFVGARTKLTSIDHCGILRGQVCAQLGDLVEVRIATFPVTDYIPRNQYQTSQSVFSFFTVWDWKHRRNVQCFMESAKPSSQYPLAMAV